MEVDLVTIGKNPRHTGIGRYIWELYHHLQERGLDVTITGCVNLPLADRLSLLHSFPLGVQNHRPGAIVHFTQIMGCAQMLWRPVRPAVATVHDLGVLELPEEWQIHDPIARQILRLSLAGLKRIDIIVAVSEFTRQGLINHLGIAAEKVVTVYSGIDHEIFRVKPNARERLSNKYPQLKHRLGPWLLYVGSELPRKNLGILFETLSYLRQIFSDISLLKVGSCGSVSYRERTLDEISKVAVNDCVFFFENISDQDLALFYSAADVLVHPSKLEGFGFPILEAMACGTPVVCSDSGSLPEIAGDAALIINAKDAHSFSSAVADTLSDESLIKRQSRAGILRSADFTWERTSEILTDVYCCL